MTENRPHFATRLGVIATTVGSAVGLGNIWRFPYEAGTHGGGAFLMIYILCIAVIGIPVICAEFVMGRASRRNIFGAFRTLAPKGGRYWQLMGVAGIVGSIMILAFYSVVAGWTIEYLMQSLAGTLEEVASTERQAAFDSFTGGWRCVLWTLVILGLNCAIVLGGVRKGIERVSNLLMPLLFVLLITLALNSLLLPGAGEGLKFLFRPDFSTVDSSVVLGALGQAFFSLSLGLGTMMIYASYFSPSTPLLKSAATTAGLDTLVALIAGVIIFPAVFTFGAEPSAGPKLVFEVLPDIFHRMPGGVVWSTVFFLLLLLASLTSTISMSEISVAYFSEQWGISRRKAVAVNTAIALVLGTLCALSFGPLSDFTICGKTVFGLFDYVASNIIMPLGGMLISIFVGWVLRRSVFDMELSPAPRALLCCLAFCLRFIAPGAIAVIFIAYI
ncbi:MAG: sodium-dependent transporter [Muribaculaceae bacterium]|nr:sodium-dependent transporter [Muribaculaceae bacterium]MDE6131094.1 sodium-dependent transporter [Muribaculaceae bacterium]